jgi:hypothetical protein
MRSFHFSLVSSADREVGCNINVHEAEPISGSLESVLDFLLHYVFCMVMYLLRSLHSKIISDAK